MKTDPTLPVSKLLLQGLGLLAILFLLPLQHASAQTKPGIGDNVAEKAKEFDHCHIFKRDGQEWDRVIFQKNNDDVVDYHFAYCDKQGQIILVLPEGYVFEYPTAWFIETDYESPLSDFHEGLAVVRNSETGLFGFMDRQGKIVIAAQHDYVGPFSEGLAFFADIMPCMGGNSIQGLVGYLDKQGKSAFELPAVLSKLYGCCYFHGEPFQGGEAVMSTRENGYDCNSFSQIKVNKAGEVIEYDGNLLDPHNQPVKLD